ncbi:unnamed protein product [Thlaspi arvense]|uniref:Uncharacterized protein n=1 Tax=Thlaspi arvense TaxID=13288 RepID=A0AAU9RYI5_THLAR|nr:unnamed protein product [Thlaspi arvense]
MQYAARGLEEIKNDEEIYTVCGCFDTASSINIAEILGETSQSSETERPLTSRHHTDQSCSEAYKRSVLKESKHPWYTLRDGDDLARLLKDASQAYEEDLVAVRREKDEQAAEEFAHQEIWVEFLSSLN